MRPGPGWRALPDADPEHLLGVLYGLLALALLGAALWRRPDEPAGALRWRLLAVTVVLVVTLALLGGRRRRGSPPSLGTHTFAGLFYVTDRLGSTVVAANPSAVQARFVYRPFGDGVVQQGEALHHRFTGGQRDPSGVYALGVRSYDPELGRFLQPDALVPDPADPQAHHRYAYALNSPTNLVDPTGFQSCHRDEGCGSNDGGQTVGGFGGGGGASGGSGLAEASAGFLGGLLQGGIFGSGGGGGGAHSFDDAFGRFLTGLQESRGRLAGLASFGGGSGGAATRSTTVRAGEGASQSGVQGTTEAPGAATIGLGPGEITFGRTSQGEPFATVTAGQGFSGGFNVSATNPPGFEQTLRRQAEIGAEGPGSVVTLSGTLKGNVALGPVSFGGTLNIGLNVANVTTPTDVVTFFVPFVDFGPVPATGTGTIPRFKFTGLGGVEAGAFRLR